jgi:hypothetical protein
MAEETKDDVFPRYPDMAPPSAAVEESYKLSNENLGRLQEQLRKVRGEVLEVRVRFQDRFHEQRFEGFEKVL